MGNPTRQMKKLRAATRSHERSGDQFLLVPYPGLLGNVKHIDEGVSKTTVLNSHCAVREHCPFSLSRMGLSLIPLQASAKTPSQGFSWKPYQTTGTTTEQVEQWSQEFPDCNWAVLLGRPSGLVALDVDSAAALRWVEVQGGFRPNGETPPWYETGRGWQFLFRLPVDLLDVRGVNPSPGVEIRANGQYSVIPPSIHPNGKAYRWKKPPESLDTTPYAPQWMIDTLQGKAAYTPVPKKKTPIQRGTVAPEPVERHKELAGYNRGLLRLAGTKWLEASVFGKGYRNAAFFALACLYKAVGLSRRECEQLLNQWRLNQTRPVYGTYPDRQTEPEKAFECVWKYAYGLDLSRLTSIQNAGGETLPESLAIQLVRSYPSKRNRSERIHKPLFESVARVLVALKEAKAFKPTMLTHEELGRLAGISPDRVAKVAGFLEEIGIKSTHREGRSPVSCYSLNTLNRSPLQLIKHFANWREYRGLWREFFVMCKGLWRTIRRWMKQFYDALNAIWNKIKGASQGETIGGVAGEGDISRPRGPPIDSGRLDARIGDLRGDLVLCSE